MPFGTAYMVNNLGVSFTALPTIYLITGLFTVFVGPLVGKASDSFGKFNTFLFGTTLTIIMVAIWTNLPTAGLVTVIIVNVLMFTGIFSRMIPSQALMSAIPEPTTTATRNPVPMASAPARRARSRDAGLNSSGPPTRPRPRSTARHQRSRHREARLHGDGVGRDDRRASVPAATGCCWRSRCQEPTR